MKTTITKSEYLQVVGLLTLSRMHNRKLQDILTALLQLTGEEIEYGHASDAVFDKESDADAMLKKMGIAVVDDHRSAASHAGGGGGE